MKLSLPSALTLLCLLLLPTITYAQTVDTLEKIRKNRVMTIGVRDNSLPFSTLSQGMASGYSVELCNKVLDAVRKELKQSDLKVRYVPVTAADRIAKIKDGQIDIECGNTVNTKSRQTDVSFSYTIFYSGERLMARKGSGVGDMDTLSGKTLAIVKGSTAEKMFTQVRDSQLSSMKLQSFASVADAFKALEANQVAAFAQLDILAEAQRLQSHTPDAYAMTGKALSIEPLALMVRKDDAAFLGLVDKTLAGLYSSGEINAIYDRWFNSGLYQIPMSKLLRDNVLRPNHEPAVALGLGYLL